MTHTYWAALNSFKVFQSDPYEQNYNFTLLLFKCFCFIWMCLLPNRLLRELSDFYLLHLTFEITFFFIINLFHCLKFALELKTVFLHHIRDHNSSNLYNWMCLCKKKITLNTLYYSSGPFWPIAMGLITDRKTYSVDQ